MIENYVIPHKLKCKSTWDAELSFGEDVKVSYLLGSNRNDIRLIETVIISFPYEKLWEENRNSKKGILYSAHNINQKET